MTVRSVVHKDFLDARRSKIVWFVGGHYALLTVLFFLQVWVSDSGSHPAVLEALWNMVFVGAVFVPAIALVAAYLAIAGERESGSIKHLLSTPVSRRDVVVGKYLSRTMIVGASLLLGFVLAAASRRSCSTRSWPTSSPESPSSRRSTRWRTWRSLSASRQRPPPGRERWPARSGFTSSRT